MPSTGQYPHIHCSMHVAVVIMVNFTFVCSASSTCLTFFLMCSFYLPISIKMSLDCIMSNLISSFLFQKQWKWNLWFQFLPRAGRINLSLRAGRNIHPTVAVFLNGFCCNFFQQVSVLTSRVTGVSQVVDQSQISAFPEHCTWPELGG